LCREANGLSDVYSDEFAQWFFLHIITSPLWCSDNVDAVKCTVCLTAVLSFMLDCTATRFGTHVWPYINYQLDALIIIYSQNIILLYMFRASSAHLQEDTVVYMQHMVLSLSMRVLGGLSVHSLSED